MIAPPKSELDISFPGISLALSKALPNANAMVCMTKQLNSRMNSRKRHVMFYANGEGSNERIQFLEVCH